MSTLPVTLQPAGPGGASMALAVLALLGVAVLTQDGTAGIHGDLGYILFLLQLVGTTAISTWLLGARWNPST